MLTRREISGLVADSCAGIPAADTDEMAVPSYLHRNPAIRWIIRRRLEVIASLMRKRSRRRWLDFGCGLGLLAHEMTGSSDRIFVSDVVLDPVQTLVARYRLSNVVPVPPSGLRQAIGSGTLDAIVAADVLEHVIDLPFWVEQFGDLLDPHGVLFLSGPTESLLYRMGRFVAGFAGDYHVRSVYDIEEEFGGGGWQRLDRCAIPPFAPAAFFRVSVWRPPLRSAGARHPAGGSS